MKTLAERCRAIELLVLDVDGVLTDGRIIYTDDGTETKEFHVRDGSGMKAWRSLGKQTVIITGRRSKAVERRAAELGIVQLHQGVDDKRAVYLSVLTTGGWKPEQACCIGDDFTDLSLLKNCGLAVAVADACPEARKVAQFVTQQPGGRGAVRETIELILRCQGKWSSLVENAEPAK